ncbi:MAG TPA: 4Fe-4S binding protein [Bellilinea sp.]|nr:4Fe-4S binding protein [Bellilinea sp.]
MIGKGFIDTLLGTLKRFVTTYTEDLRYGKKRYFTEEGVAARGAPDTKGIFTVQYPEEKIPVPEEFRFIPFLVYDVKEDGTKDLRCTACGICAKSCPPQCIWITRDKDPVTGKPVPHPVKFFIDIDICMNCGFCAEYCPFDAIKMDHEYELAAHSRKHHIYDLDSLPKSAEYYKQIRPLNYALEEQAKAEKAAAKKPAAAAE